MSIARPIADQASLPSIKYLEDWGSAEHRELPDGFRNRVATYIDAIVSTR